MKTSLTETASIEKYILGQMEPGEELLFQTELILDRRLRENYYAQKKIHDVIKVYNRDKLKAQMMEVHHKLFANTSTSFARSILHLFKQ
jgi:hypothetical protein